MQSNKPWKMLLVNLLEVTKLFLSVINNYYNQNWIEIQIVSMHKIKMQKLFSFTHKTIAINKK